MVALYHQPYHDVSSEELYDAQHIGYEIAATIAENLDGADLHLSNAADRLEALAGIPWESRADIRAELVRARALIEQVQRTVDPQSFYDEGRS